MIERLRKLENKRQIGKAHVPKEVVDEIEKMVGESIQHSNKPSKLDKLTNIQEIQRVIEEVIYKK